MSAIKNIIRALRLPFILASTLPFIFGSLLAKDKLNALNFILGLVAVGATHLCANLINDYADSQSGADWRDRKFYAFFGGSKLIQEGVFAEVFYFYLALLFGGLALICITVLAVSLKSLSIIGFYLLILFLGWSYSMRPIQFAYRGLGELIVFTLFGPAVVMGGYFIQTKIFPAWEVFILSLPFGFFTAAILFANEIPDFTQDIRSGKFTWVNLLGPQNSFLIYYLLVCLGFSAIILVVYLGYLSKISALSVLFIPLAVKSGYVLQKYWMDKDKLVESSKATVTIQTFVSLILILDLLL
jgi:1,4-dihydroxy-2-naphthoate octaprenyltransferase